MNPLYDHRLLTLATLVETGSFTATAERLFISQPAVSQQITALENELNLELVHRRGKRIQVTKAAEHLTNYLHRESLNVDQLLEQLRGAEPVPLRLGATLSLAEFMLPELLGELVDAGHQVKIHTANTDQLLQAIDDGTIDLALVEGNFHKEAYGVLPWGRRRLARSWPNRMARAIGKRPLTPPLLTGSGIRDPDDFGRVAGDPQLFG